MGDSLLGLSPVAEAVLVAAIPAASMMFGSLLVLLVPVVNPKFQAIMQNLSAGIILAAVSTELFPLLDSHGGQSDSSAWGLVIGFAAGMGGLFGIKRFLDYAESMGEEEQNSLISSENPFYGTGNKEDISLDGFGCNPEDLVGKLKRVQGVLAHLQDHLKRQVPDRFAVDRHVHEILHHLEDSRRFLRGEQKLMGAEQIKFLEERLLAITAQVEENGQQIQAGGLTPMDMDLKISKLQQALTPLLSTKRGVFRRWDVAKPSPLGLLVKEKIPWGQWVAVVIDAFVDGFLIGLAYIAEPRAGLVMGGATCIEMGFLGLTFAARSKQVTTRLCKFLGLVLSPPVALCVGSFLGANLANSVTDYPSVFVGFIAFSIVALLFLVTQELLIEAFENTDSEGLWYVNIWLFIGIFIVLISEKVQV